MGFLYVYVGIFNLCLRGSMMVNFERKGFRIIENFMKIKMNVVMIDENFEINFYKVN